MSPNPGSPPTWALVLAVSGSATAVYVPVPQPHVQVVDDTGNEIGDYPLPAPPSAAFPKARSQDRRPDHLVDRRFGDGLLEHQHQYRYTIERSGPLVPLGPGVMMAQKLLVPVTGGIAVFDPETGERERVIAVDRPPADTAIVPAVVGDTILEQRGRTLVALGQ